MYQESFNPFYFLHICTLIVFQTRLIQNCKIYMYIANIFVFTQAMIPTKDVLVERPGEVNTQEMLMIQRQPQSLSRETKVVQVVRVNGWVTVGLEGTPCNKQ